MAEVNAREGSAASVSESYLLMQLETEVRRQDAKHGPFQGTRLGRSRLALACLEDEVAEAKEAWRADRKLPEWPTARVEVLQVAAVAFRALRDAFNDDALDEEGTSNHA